MASTSNLQATLTELFRRQNLLNSSLADVRKTVEQLVEDIKILKEASAGPCALLPRWEELGVVEDAEQSFQIPEFSSAEVPEERMPEKRKLVSLTSFQDTRVSAFLSEFESKHGSLVEFLSTFRKDHPACSAAEFKDHMIAKFRELVPDEFMGLNEFVERKVPITGNDGRLSHYEVHLGDRQRLVGDILRAKFKNNLKSIDQAIAASEVQIVFPLPTPVASASNAVLETIEDDLRGDWAGFPFAAVIDPTKEQMLRHSFSAVTTLVFPTLRKKTASYADLLASLQHLAFAIREHASVEGITIQPEKVLWNSIRITASMFASFQMYGQTFESLRQECTLISLAFILDHLISCETGSRSISARAQAFLQEIFVNDPELRVVCSKMSDPAKIVTYLIGKMNSIFGTVSAVSYGKKRSGCAEQSSRMMSVTPLLFCGIQCMVDEWIWTDEHARQANGQTHAKRSKISFDFWSKLVTGKSSEEISQDLLVRCGWDSASFAKTASRRTSRYHDELGIFAFCGMAVVSRWAGAGLNPTQHVPAEDWWVPEALFFNGNLFIICSWASDCRGCSRMCQPPFLPFQYFARCWTPDNCSILRRDPSIHLFETGSLKCFHSKLCPLRLPL